ncbi:PAP/fibrillin family protein [Phormidium sp. CCY1219]|uniref:PAP/fibrillin family protein n=1 Tax=Phormidium sp. CCY1219 TaxID=2886104 RepID=UPI002D1E70C2|nr:PAP/fibrillin family protein [Phormidium sp. CCY1219]MEB3829984.1 PAP/fibrillin family protein [Phormidium sp. CCY1219]
MSEKMKLLRAIAGKNRGLLASPEEKIEILNAIADLEAQNPTESPTEARDLLGGDWRLLYTTSGDLLNLDLPPIIGLGQIYQCIRPATGELYNIAEILGLPFLDGIVSVTAKIQPLSERRVDVKFQRWIVGLQNLIDYRSPAEFVAQIEAGKDFSALSFPVDRAEQYNWLDTTYLDEDLRIGRGNNGSIYVLTKS